MSFQCIACDSGECVSHGSVFVRLGSNDTLSVAGKPLVRVHQCAECDTWELFDKPMNEGGKQLGEISLYHYSEFPYPSINAINVDKIRGQGMGRQIVIALAKFYGGLTSDPQRNTNELAKKMWRAIPGAQEVVSPDQHQHRLNPDPAERLPWQSQDPNDKLSKGTMFIVKGTWRWKFKNALLHRQSFGYVRVARDLSGVSGKGAIGPLDVTVWRSGALNDWMGRGIYFGGTREDAAAYSFAHQNTEPIPYRVQAENVYAAESQPVLFRELFHKSWGEEVHRVDLTKFKGNNSNGAARTLEAQMMKELRKRNYDALVYTKPMPPAKTELVVLDKSVQIQPIESSVESPSGKPDLGGSIGVEGIHDHASPRASLSRRRATSQP